MKRLTVFLGRALDFPVIVMKKPRPEQVILSQ